jgi:pimeloyl-ACP methyl ester carboxylesterase
VILATLAWFGAGTPAFADNLRLRSPEGLFLNAELHRGDPQRPAIVVLHGFLQTREFLTTQSIIHSLSQLGYTVVAPNLSFGVSDRRQSLQCQAPHKHRFEDDLRELDVWVDWLRRQGYAQIILVGHSWGSQHGIGYAETRSEAPIAAVVAISLVRAEQPAAVRARQDRQAETRLARRDMSLQPYALGFCKQFMATPQSYLSYARWDDARVAASLERLQERRLPVYAVIGSGDRRIDDEWMQQLRRRTAQVTVIEGANHFFSSIHEFELNDRLETILAQAGAPVTQR